MSRAWLPLLVLLFAVPLAAEETKSEGKVVELQMRSDPEHKGESWQYWKVVETEIDGQKSHTTVEITAEEYASELDAMSVPVGKLDQMIGPHMFLMANDAKIIPFFLISEHGDKPEFQAATGISRELAKEMETFVESLAETFEETYTRLSTKAEATDDPEELAAVSEEFVSILRGAFDQIATKMDESLSPEQMLRLRELELQSNPFGDDDSPLIDFGGYEALELTEEQKKQLDELREEYLTELMKDMELFAQITSGVIADMDMEKAAEAMENLQKKAALVKAKILALLTPAQAAKFEQLLANRPKFLDTPTVAADADGTEDEEWKKSWKPGDPVPEGHEPPKPRGRFPFRPL